MTVKYAWLAAAALTFAASAPVSAALAPLDYQLIQSYDLVTDYALNHGISYNRYGADLDGSGMTNSFNLGAGGGTVTDWFPKDPYNPPILTYVMASSNLNDEVTEEAGQDLHLVIGFNESFATTLLGDGKDFTETFDGYDESSLIAALALLDTPDLPADDPGHDAQMQAKDDASGLLFSFSDTVYTLGGLVAADGGKISLVSFSTPSVAGSGTALLTRVPVTSDTPEPGTWLMMVAGFGAIGFVLRSRKRIALSFS